MEIRKITPDPDDYQAIHEDEPDLKKGLNVGVAPDLSTNAPQPPRKAVEPPQQGQRSLTPMPPFPGRYGPPRPITGQTGPTGEDQ